MVSHFCFWYTMNQNRMDHSMGKNKLSNFSSFFVYDVIIAGGSIAGLCCAREIAKRNFSVLVIEEDFEIGSPEHCGGLISLEGIHKLGVIPSSKTLENQIEHARIYAPNGKNFEINSKKQKVFVINRRELDKQLALQAQKNGAQIRVKTRFLDFKNNIVKTSEGQEKCKIFVDARGVSALSNKDRDGMLLSAQYEVYADWIEKGTVEVFFDQEKYPGFFAWIIASNTGIGKIGIAGRAINPQETLESFLSQKGNYSVIRKIFAPIWIKGQIKNFIEKNKIIIGDAAGQSKPTTAGGIYSCGMGGIFAGRAISEYLESKDYSKLSQYQKSWEEKFSKEFSKQLLSRKMLERIDNPTLVKIFDSISPEIIKDISEKDDFDFHTGSLIKLLGLKSSLKTAQALLGNEIKRLVSK